MYKANVQQEASMIKQLPLIFFSALAFLISYGGNGIGLIPALKAAPIFGDYDEENNPRIAVDADFAGDGTTVGIPAGFSPDECAFTASVATVDGKAISVYASINQETGQVICKKVVQNRVEIPPETQSCTASYLMICLKKPPQS